MNDCEGCYFDCSPVASLGVGRCYWCDDNVDQMKTGLIKNPKNNIINFMIIKNNVDCESPKYSGYVSPMRALALHTLYGHMYTVYLIHIFVSMCCPIINLCGKAHQKASNRPFSRYPYEREVCVSRHTHEYFILLFTKFMHAHIIVDMKMIGIDVKMQREREGGERNGHGPYRIVASAIVLAIYFYKLN